MKVYYNEHNTKAAGCLREFAKLGIISPGTVDERDVELVDPRHLLEFDRVHLFAGIGGWEEAFRIAGWGESKAWTASFPCQPFSVGGAMEGFNDPRHLWPVGFNLIQKCRPPIIFGEQVENAVGMGWLDIVFDDLEKQGYACAASILRADSIGAPHRRKRLYWLAANSDFQGGEGLEPGGSIGQAGQWNWCGEEDLQLVAKSPFQCSDRWPQPLLRHVDDGLWARVSGCHVAGNAIVPALAAKFIQASVSAIIEQRQPNINP